MMTRRVGGWTHRLPYLVWSYDYSHASAGPKALHRLCHELNVAGETAYVGAGWTTNPDWRTPSHEPAFGRSWPPNQDWIAVYPEVVSGNPWNAPHVARWVLNKPGLLGGDRTYEPSEMVFTWATAFHDATVLQLPTIETEIYGDWHEPRSGALYWVGKGVPGDTAGAAPITQWMRENRHALAAALNHAEILRSFDPVSGMNWIAALCGCPVLIVPTGERIEPEPVREQYRAVIDAAPGQLARFIEITQAVGVLA